MGLSCAYHAPRLSSGAVRAAQVVMPRGPKPRPDEELEEERAAVLGALLDLLARRSCRLALPYLPGKGRKNVLEIFTEDNDAFSDEIKSTLVATIATVRAQRSCTKPVPDIVDYLDNHIRKPYSCEFDDEAAFAAIVDKLCGPELLAALPRTSGRNQSDVGRKEAPPQQLTPRPLRPAAAPRERALQPRAHAAGKPPLPDRRLSSTSTRTPTPGPMRPPPPPAPRAGGSSAVSGARGEATGAGSSSSVGAQPDEVHLWGVCALPGNHGVEGDSSLCVICGLEEPPNHRARNIAWAGCSECTVWAHTLCVRAGNRRMRAADWKCSTCTAGHAH